MQATIVIPLLDQRVSWLEKSLLSALEQSAPCEVIVIYSSRTNDAAMQLLDSLAARYPNLKSGKRHPGDRFPEAVNMGFNLATTDRIGLLFSDDWIEAECVERCLEIDADIVSTSQTGYAEDAETVVYRRSQSSEAFNALGKVEEKANYLTHFFLFKKSILDLVNGVDENVGLTGCDDFDMIWSMLEQNATVGIVPQHLYNARDHPGIRLTNRPAELQIEDFKKILEKHGVEGSEFDRILSAHGRWFGRPAHAVLQLDGKSPN